MMEGADWSLIGNHNTVEAEEVTLTIEGANPDTEAVASGAASCTAT